MKVDAYASAMRFQWITSDLAACRGPQSRADLEFLFNQGIRALVRLADQDETGVDKKMAEAAHLTDRHEPVPDLQAPTQRQIDRILRFIHANILKGRRVAVSCYAGQGRTGTIVACYLVSKGKSADEAIEELIRLRPFTAEIQRVQAQLEAIHKFERRLRAVERAR